MYLKNQLILILNHSRQELLKVLARVDTDQEIYPGWTIKEVLAHVAGWDACVAASLEAHSRDEHSSTNASLEPDIFNQQSVADRETFTYEQVLEDLEAQRQKLNLVIGEMAEEKFQAPALFPWGQVGAVEDVVRGFAAHERRHAEEIVRLFR
jgi:uncharacterized damage-inducible protein DinB